MYSQWQLPKIHTDLPVLKGWAQYEGRSSWLYEVGFLAHGRLGLDSVSTSEISTYYPWLESMVLALGHTTR